LVCVSKEASRMLLWARCILMRMLMIAKAKCVLKGMEAIAKVSKGT